MRQYSSHVSKTELGGTALLSFVWGLCRGVYHGQDMSVMELGEPEVLEGTRRSKRPRTTAAANSPLITAIKGLQCFQANGNTIPLHHCDVVFMTYESLRRELGYQQKCAPVTFCGKAVQVPFGPPPPACLSTPSAAACREARRTCSLLCNTFGPCMASLQPKADEVLSCLGVRA